MTGILLFSFIALIAIVTSIGMLMSRNAVYSALFLVLNFASVAFLYVTLGAPFIAMAQVTVYAGAIMILFLFVIMLLGAERLEDEADSRRKRTLAIVMAVIFLGEIATLVLFKAGVPPDVLTIPASDFASPAQIGLTLFSSYLLTFEVTSLLLLVAIIGAIVLTKVESARQKPVRPGKE